MSVFFGRGEGWVYGNSVFAIQILREEGPGGIRQCLGRNTAMPWEGYGKALGGIRQGLGRNTAAHPEMHFFVLFFRLGRHG